MKVTFLGTGTSQGVPVLTCDCAVCQSEDPRDKRLRTSAHIETQNLSIVIDAGPDFRYQSLRANIRKLDAILLTHQHRDHIAGMDDVRSFNFKQGKAMPVYASEDVIEQLKRELHYAFEKKYPGVPQLEIHQIENQNFKVFDLEITPIRVFHHKLPVFGFRIHDFTYITDANFIPEEEITKIQGTRILVVNALQKDDHLSHFTLQEALDLINIVNPDHAYLTHISHKMGLHKEVSKALPSNVSLAYDGLTIEI